MPHRFRQGEYIHSVSKALKGKETTGTVQAWWFDTRSLGTSYNHATKAEIRNSCSLQLDVEYVSRVCIKTPSSNRAWEVLVAIYRGRRRIGGESHTESARVLLSVLSGGCNEAFWVLTGF